MKNIFEIDYGIVQRFVMKDWHPLKLNTEFRIPMNFYKQETLGTDFSEVLHKNLWNLYER